VAELTGDEERPWEWWNTARVARWGRRQMMVVIMGGDCN